MSLKHLKLGKEYTVEEIGRMGKCKIEDHTVGWHIEDNFVILLLTLDKEIMEIKDPKKYMKLTTKERRKEDYYYRDYFDIEKRLFYWEGPTDLDENHQDIQSFINKEKPFYLFVREYYKKTVDDMPYEKFTYAGRIVYKTHSLSNSISGRPVSFVSQLLKIEDKGRLAKLYRWKSKESEIAQEQFLRNQEEDKQSCKEWINLSEGKELEFKAIFFSEDPLWTDRCLKTVCAFANTVGGHLIIGVKDPTKTKKTRKHESPIVLGIEKDIKFESNDDYKTKITNRIKTTFSDVDIDYILFHKCYNDKYICRIKIKPLPRSDTPCKYKGRFYERSIDTSRMVPLDEEINFIDRWKDN